MIRLEREAGKGKGEAELSAENPRWYKIDGSFWVPRQSRYQSLLDDAHHNVGDSLNKALAGIETANTSLDDVLEHIDFTRKVGQSKIPDIKLRQLITHFGTYRLRNEDFEFPDLLGAAYEYLIGEFADSAGKKGGEFYTPRSVVRMMVRLIKPEHAARHLRPLLRLRRHADRRPRSTSTSTARTAARPTCSARSSTARVWSIAKMNMLLHGISTADLQNDDTLAEPQHVEGGELMRFDRVLTNPPFSINWGNTEKHADGTSAWAPKFPERFRYGQVPLGAKKADLMFVQHMLAVTRDGGMVATVMPHGVLFRGGEEKTIRAGIIDDDLLEAVIGVAPNLFYGTGIPACILVLRQRGRRREPGQRQAGRAPGQGAVHQCRPRVLRRPGAELPAARAHREDRHHLRRIPRHRRLLGHRRQRHAARANDYNLNIRRYADNAPPPEPHDVRAHLVGGVPKAEVQAKAALFARPRPGPAGPVRRARRQATSTSARAGPRARTSSPPSKATPAWSPRRPPSARPSSTGGSAHSARITALSGQMDNAASLVALRNELLASFSESLEAIGLLDPFQVRGIVAGFWYQTKYDFLTLMARGAKGVVDAWRTSIVTALEDKAEQGKPAGT